MYVSKSWYTCFVMTDGQGEAGAQVKGKGPNGEYIIKWRVVDQVEGGNSSGR